MANDQPDQTPTSHLIGPVFWAAIGVGILLIAIGGGSLAARLTSAMPALLVLCAGVGIVLGAFGSSATVRYRGVVVAGVGALAVILFALTERTMEKGYAFGDISGDVRSSTIRVVGDRAYHGAFEGRHYQFVVLGREIQKRNLEVEIVFPPTEGKEDDQTFLFECVDSSELSRALGSESTVEWRFDRKRGVLLRDGRDGGAVTEVGTCGAGAAEPQAAGLILIPRAHAEDDPARVRRQLDDLRSGSVDVRREARQALAGGGLAAVRPMLDTLAGADVSYRARLGIIVALTEMLRADRSLGDAVAAQITPEDLDRLAAAAGDPDRTIRVYASEFLYDLADPRVVPIARQRLVAASEDGRYNLLLVIKGAYQRLPAAEREELARGLSTLRTQVGPRTSELIDTIIKR